MDVLVLKFRKAWNTTESKNKIEIPYDLILNMAVRHIFDSGEVIAEVDNINIPNNFMQ